MTTTIEPFKSDEEINSDLAALAKARDVAGLESYGRELASARRPPPRIILGIAQALRDAGAGTAAIEWFAMIESGEKPYEFSRAQIARLMLSAGDYDGVLRLTGTIEPSSMADGMATARIRALAAKGRYDEAVAFATATSRERPASIALLEAAADAALAGPGWSATFPFIERAVAASDEPRLRMRRAAGLFQLDRTDEALVELDALANNPEFFLRAKTLMLRIHIRGSDPELVLRTCDEILERAPDNEFALETLIRQNIEERNYDAAATAFERAAAVKPDRFIREMFDFLVQERRGRLRKGLAPFKEDRLDNNLPDEVKERIANAFYSSGQFHLARRLAKQLPAERQALLIAKISLGVGKRPRLDGLPEDSEGRLVKALFHYLEGSFEECLALLEHTEPSRKERLGLMNFKCLARSKRVLSNRFFARAENVPVDTSAPLPTIQQLWVGSDLSYIERLSIRSFVAAGHPTHLYTYDPQINAPPGCVIKDAGEILPREQIFAHSNITGRSKGSLAGFADLFRWKLLYERGGIWADCDVVCLDPIPSPRIISTELARIGTLVVPAITNCFFGAEAGEPAFGKAYEDAAEMNNSQLMWGEIGIHKMAELVAEQGWGKRLTAPTDICAIPPYRMIDAIYGAFDVREHLADTGCRAIHLYNEVMRMVGMDKNGAFPPNGVLGVLERLVAGRERGEPRREWRAL